MKTKWGLAMTSVPRRATRLLSFLAVAVVAAGAGVGVTLAVDQPAASTTTTSLPGAGAVPSPATSPSSGRTTGTVDAQEVVNKVEPGLVVVNTTLKYSNEAAAGTGMVINSDGLVLTNNHVIENSTKITATVITTGKTYPATVIGYDKTADVALIRLQGATGLHTACRAGLSTALSVPNASARTTTCHSRMPPVRTLTPSAAETRPSVLPWSFLYFRHSS
jgi:S1-C subfamily serine protease